jgi:hypothetical protein
MLFWRWTWRGSLIPSLSYLTVAAAATVLSYPLIILQDQAKSCLDSINREAPSREVLVCLPFGRKLDDATKQKIKELGRTQDLTAAEYRDVRLAGSDADKAVHVMLLPFHGAGGEPMCLPFADGKCPATPPKDAIFVSQAVLHELGGDWSEDANVRLFFRGVEQREPLDLKGFLQRPWSETGHAMVHPEVLAKLARSEHSPPLSSHSSEAANEVDFRGMRISLHDIKDVDKLKRILASAQIAPGDVKAYRDRRPETQGWARINDFAQAWWKLAWWCVLAIWILSSYVFVGSHIAAHREDILALDDFGRSGGRLLLLFASLFRLLLVLGLTFAIAVGLSWKLAAMADPEPCVLSEPGSGIWALGGAGAGLHSGAVLRQWAYIAAASLLAGVVTAAFLLWRLKSPSLDE